jgi:hemerythrin superfamily protein
VTDYLEILSGFSEDIEGVIMHDVRQDISVMRSAAMLLDDLLAESRDDITEENLRLFVRAVLDHSDSLLITDEAALTYYKNRQVNG